MRPLFIILIALMLFGCATTHPERPNDFERARLHYVRGNHQTALDLIEKLLKLRPTEMKEKQRAEMLILKGICLEDTGRLEAARTVYQQIRREYPGTDFGGVARMRAEGKYGDQKELLSIDVGSVWVRCSKIELDGIVLQKFYFARRDPRVFLERLLVVSVDRRGQANTVDEVIFRARQAALKRSKELDVEVIERTEKEAILEVHFAEAESGKRWTAMSRVIVTPTRLHGIEFLIPKMSLAPGVRARLIHDLKEAKLVEAPMTKLAAETNR